jgi:hypothetical protein
MFHSKSSISIGFSIVNHPFMETHQWIFNVSPLKATWGPRLVLCHGLVAIAAKVFITSCREKPRFPETNCIQPDRNIEYI